MKIQGLTKLETIAYHLVQVTAVSAQLKALARCVFLSITQIAQAVAFPVGFQVTVSFAKTPPSVTNANWNTREGLMGLVSQEGRVPRMKASFSQLVCYYDIKISLEKKLNMLFRALEK